MSGISTDSNLSRPAGVQASRIKSNNRKNYIRT